MSLSREEAIIAMVQDGVEVIFLAIKWSYRDGEFYRGANKASTKRMAIGGYEIYTPPLKMAG